MSYYHYRPDANRFAGIALQPQDRNVIRLCRNDEPILNQWIPIAVLDIEDNPIEKGDFPSLSDYNELPVMSERAVAALNTLLADCEMLPIIHPSGRPYSIIHVMTTVDAIDVDRSDVVRYTDGGIMRIARYCLDTSKVQGKHIFKLPKAYGGELIVDEHLRGAVEAAGLLGLVFKELPMVNITGPSPA